MKLIQGQTVDEILENYAELLMTSNQAKKVTVEKLGLEGFVLKIEGCVFNSKGEVHELLKPQDVTCAWATIAQAIYSEKTGKKPAVTFSTFERDLSVTEIKLR